MQPYSPKFQKGVQDTGKKAKQKDQNSPDYLMMFFCIVTLLMITLTGMMFFTGCSVTFQNVSAEGSATDLSDEPHLQQPN